MSYPYAKPLPIDTRGNSMHELSPDADTLATTAAAPPAASSVISFNTGTTLIEITALNNSLAYKWGPDSVIAAAGATANFDGIVPVNTTRRIVIPVSVYGASALNSVAGGANLQNGLYTTMAVIATASILTAITEY